MQPHCVNKLYYMVMKLFWILITGKHFSEAQTSAREIVEWFLYFFILEYEAFDAQNQAPFILGVVKGTLSFQKMSDKTNIKQNKKKHEGPIKHS